MAILTDMRERISSLDSRFGVDVDGVSLLAAIRRWETESVIELVQLAAAVKHDADRLMAVGAAILTERSSRDLGQSGAAAVRGHASPVALVQSISGGTRADAVRAVRIGGALLEGAVPVNEASDVTSDSLDAAWHEPLGRAMLAGGLTPPQHEAILRGLGEPPEHIDGAPEVWGLAAAQLVAEAEGIEVEELARRARQVRDALDPVGTEERHARRFEARSFRAWTDADGGRHGRIDFDDESAAFWDAVIASALRPRRGGPRFMTAEEREAAADLIADTRTNEQLAYDLITDVFRAGTLATASDVFGARQPGVRMVMVRDAIGPRDAFGRMVATAHLEDGGDALPGSVVDRALCDVGSVEVTVDSCGNPLDVGREERLFTPKQKLALAVRDGGCLWPGCRVPASYCEAHHSEHWVEGGRTDTESGVLLCRFHHMLLHNAGWKIGRGGRGPFVLHRPSGMPGAPVVLGSKSAVRWAWDPPPPEVRVGWRAA
jgi:hypothetical protein